MRTKRILFHVDGTAPEITSIAGLEDTIINAQSVDATYSVYDTMGLKSIKVLVDGKVVERSLISLLTEITTKAIL